MDHQQIFDMLDQATRTLLMQFQAEVEGNTVTQEAVKDVQAKSEEVGKYWRKVASAALCRDDKQIALAVHYFLPRVCRFTTSWQWLAGQFVGRVPQAALQRIGEYIAAYWRAAGGVLDEYIAAQQRSYRLEPVEELPVGMPQLVKTWATVAHMVHSAMTADALLYVFWAISDEYQSLEAVQGENAVYNWYLFAIDKWGEAAQAFFEAAHQSPNTPLVASDYCGFGIQCLYQMRRLWKQTDHLLQPV